jgi:hypothetical protein
MAVREFTDQGGQRWRVWDVSPESIEPLTKAEDYLADCYREGWIVFETFDGREKRRLCPPPYGWAHRSDANLEDLLMRAEVLRPRGQVRFRDDAVTPADLPPSVPLDVARAIPRDAQGDIDMRYLRVVRSFRYPSGDIWRVSAVTEGPGGAPVLRFSSETQAIDVADWPADWSDLSDERLAALMQTGHALHERRRPVPPSRRHDDPDPGASAR